MLCTFVTALASPVFSEIMFREEAKPVARKIVYRKKQIENNQKIFPRINLVPVIVGETKALDANALAKESIGFPNLHQKYQAYLELGFQKHFNQLSSAAAVYDLFIPLVQRDGQLFYTDMRLFDRSGKSAEGNFHLGYRRLDRGRELILGIYGAYDQRRSYHGVNYRQLTLGSRGLVA